MPAEFVNTVNVLIAPLGSIVLIFLDSLRNNAADRVQRNILLVMLGCAFVWIASEIVYYAFAGRPDMPGTYTAVRATNFLYFLFQVATLGGIALLMDYSINQDVARLKKLGWLMLAVNLVNAATLVANLFTGFMYTFSADQQYTHGSAYSLRVAIAYCILVIGVIDLALSRKLITRFMMTLSIVFMASLVAGSTLDMLIPGGRLLWPLFSLSLIFAYLFIVRADYRIDSVTGVYNRRFCDEFLLGIEKNARRDAYSIIMVDMDDFKQINDTLGHAKGDKALRDTAAIIKDSVRFGDFVGRLGGDEFLIVAASECAEEVVTRIHARIRAFNEEGRRPYKLQLSCGCDVYRPDDGRSVYAFMEHVDRLMYQCKMARRT